jgi:hypothetical protein
MKDSQAGAALTAVGVLSPLALRAPLPRLHLTGSLKTASRSTPAHTARNRDFSQTRTSGIMMYPCGLSRLHPSNEATHQHRETPPPQVAQNPGRDAAVVRSSFAGGSRLAGRQFAADVRHDGGLPRQCYLWRAATYARYGYTLLGQLQNCIAESEPEETARVRHPYPTKYPRREMDLI